jgi:hypothetical protein
VLEMEFEVGEPSERRQAPRCARLKQIGSGKPPSDSAQGKPQSKKLAVGIAQIGARLVAFG